MRTEFVFLFFSSRSPGVFVDGRLLLLSLHRRRFVSVLKSLLFLHLPFLFLSLFRSFFWPTARVIDRARSHSHTNVRKRSTLPSSKLGSSNACSNTSLSCKNSIGTLYRWSNTLGSLSRLIDVKHNNCASYTKKNIADRKSGSESSFLFHLIFFLSGEK